MCGIAGIYSLKETVAPRIIQKMMNTLRHRGKDDEGYLALDFEENQPYPLTGSRSKTEGPSIEEFTRPAHLLLGHCRLSIIDLSVAGHQPMSNEDGSMWIVYNGEIYNYLEVREELKTLRHYFRSGTDTEVILHAYEEWGTDCLMHFNGMWAFAIVDLREKMIFCSRDRAGVKPFYYCYDGKRFCFASEIKALLQFEDGPIEPNNQIIADFLFDGLRDHTRETFFKGVFQLRPAELLRFDGKDLEIQSYWNLHDKEVCLPGEGDYADHFLELFQDAIRLRLRSDVPIGSCLSGGLDSSSIVSLANRLMFEGQTMDPEQVGRRQKTFSSCFNDPVYDERRFIEKVVDRIGAEKHYVFPDPEGLWGELAQLTWHQDEPFGSTSIYAQWSVMRLARENGVTVLLDGQGGDELLAGYLPSFYHLFRQARKDFDIGLLMREGKGFLRHHQTLMGLLFQKAIGAIVPKRLRTFFPGLDRDGEGWAEEGFRKDYYRIISWPRKFEHELTNYLYHAFRFTVLPGLLHYEDRNSMAFSVEARLPFLDYRLVEYIFSLPSEQKIKEGVTKVVLRNGLKGILPEEVSNRHDKMGFVTPEEIWFRTTLRNQIHQIINSKSFASRGYFDVRKVNEIFAEHCSEKRNWSFTIWRWISLEQWFNIFIDKNPISTF
jgi:asparagine synthase (glutamine-hydrolysing)